MTKLIWQMRTGVILICVSIALYAVHYFFFKDLHFLEEYTLSNSPSSVSRLFSRL